MQLNLSTTKTTRGGIKPLQTSSHKTTINNTIFNIVTKGLYIRPIDAIVREICTNALDGHVIKGNTDEPFNITLPTNFNPHFIVRDFGCSMSNDTVFNVYAILGESTKNATSDSVGGWGVGGKSPAAYTDTFFITTYLDGIRRVYQSSCLQDTTPLELLLETETNERDGVEIKIPVKEKDFSRFLQAVKTQIAAFDLKPNIINKDYFTNGDFEYAFNLEKAESLHIPCTLLLPDNSGQLARIEHNTKIYTDCISDFISVRMGCVVYPINVTSDFYEEVKDTIKEILEISGVTSFILDLPVDSIDIKPSREDLDYTERTTILLKNVINKLLRNYTKETIEIAFHARKLPLIEACKYIEDHAKNEKMLNYITAKYSVKPFFGKERVKYNEVSSYFINSIKKDLRKSALDTYFSSDFSVSDGYKTKKMSKHEVVFHFSKELSLNIILKNRSFSKKINYWLSEGEIPDSGLYSKFNLVDFDFYNDKFSLKRKMFFGSQNGNKYIVLSQEELDVFKPVFDKYYLNVTVHELEDIPKSVRQNNSNYATTPYITNVNIFTPKKHETREFTSTQSFKAVKEIINILDKESDKKTFYFVESNNTNIYKNEFKDLAVLLNVNIAGLRFPDAFTEKVKNKKILNVLKQLELLNYLKSLIPEQKLLEIKNEYRNYLFTRQFFDLEYKLRTPHKRLIKLNMFNKIRHFFFNFAPEFVCLIPTFTSLIELKKSETKRINYEALKMQNRVAKRINTFIKYKPTLNLIDSYTDELLIMQLLEINFKEFTYDKT